MATEELYEDLSVVYKNNPTGYKMCKGPTCGWRPVRDFGVAKRYKGKPQSMQPLCFCCKRLKDRDKNGWSALGSPRRQEVKDKIAEGQRRRWAPYVDNMLPEGRRCNKCKEFKSRKHFTMKRQVRTTGEYSYKLASQCKLCRAKWAENYRKSLTREQRNIIRAKERKRNMRDMRIAQQNKNKKNTLRISTNNPAIDSQPIIDFYDNSLKKYEGGAIELCAHIGGADWAAETINGAINKARRLGRVSTNLADLVATKISGPEKFYELYPEAVPLSEAA